MKLPTDLKILQFIYKKYYGIYCSFSREEKTRETKIYVPINIKEIANNFHIDEDIIFGRLYYYLDEKYGYRKEDKSLVSFFTLSINEDKHCVNFALLSSVLAILQEDNRRFWFTNMIAVYSIFLAALAIIISLLIKT